MMATDVSSNVSTIISDSNMNYNIATPDGSVCHGKPNFRDCEIQTLNGVPYSYYYSNNITVIITPWSVLPIETVLFNK